ncbi:hypothetical protein [Roseovarius sp. A-2]|uniref:hypothetical protein n=1 Tax=Roseovarius sp. A-2 TaxID=1570360 RepID=UPI0009B513FF|nr:hypothetical protein [Roseovarius sp. A-2]
MSDKEQTNGGLDAFFEAARAQAPAPSPDLLARVLADADATRQAHSTVGLVHVHTPAPRPGIAARLYRLLGGWPAMAGLATAALTGIWIGTALPEGLLGPDDATYLVDITPEMTFDLAGGEF